MLRPAVTRYKLPFNHLEKKTQLQQGWTTIYTLIQVSKYIQNKNGLSLTGMLGFFFSPFMSHQRSRLILMHLTWSTLFTQFIKPPKKELIMPNCAIGLPFIATFRLAEIQHPLTANWENVADDCRVVRLRCQNSSATFRKYYPWRIM